jgi:hypothetical protein
MHTSVGKQPAPCMLAPLHAGSFFIASVSRGRGAHGCPFAVGTSGNIAPREVKLEDYIWRAGMNYIDVSRSGS